MQIDAITCCVGPEYAGYLARSLHLWMPGLRSLTIVTDNQTNLECLACNVVRTDVFYQHGAHFNKGAALCEAYTAADPQDWILHFDADIVPPPEWYRIAERQVNRRMPNDKNLYGCVRVLEDGKPADFHRDGRPENYVYPYGYFQMWHSSDRHAMRWPIFETHHGHAGNYDANFADQWPRDHRKDLGFAVTHLGKPRRCWFGPQGDPAKMEPIKERGLHMSRMDSNAGKERLRIPQPKVRIDVKPDTDPQIIRTLMRQCATMGPFTTTMRIG